MKKARDEQTEAWRKRISKTGLNSKDLALAPEKAGAAGIVASNWSSGFGVNKIFDAKTKKYRRSILPRKITGYCTAW